MTLKKNKLLGRFKNTILMLGVVTVLLWLLFYIVVGTYTRDNLLESAKQTATGVISELENELSEFEHITYSASHSEEIREMLGASDETSFFDMGSSASERMSGITGLYSQTDNIVLMRANGTPYRIKGELSNTALGEVFSKISMAKMPMNLSITSKDMAYIGYAAEIERGYIILLLDSEKLRQVVGKYSNYSYLGVAITADESVLYDNRGGISADLLNKLVKTSEFSIEKQIGLTPFSVTVYAENGMPDRITVYFTLALCVTVIIFLIMLVVFLRFWRCHFFLPINRVISDVELMGSGGTNELALTGEEYFDGLVIQINDTMKRIDEKEKALFLSESRIQKVEFEKQAALINSLKKQISAHFTVNSLNAVRSLIKRGESEKAESICSSLSGIMRYANSPDDYISLMEEFYVLWQYIDIMQTRYPNKLTVSMDIDDDFEQMKIPRMLIQPVVENAIIHGIGSLQDGKISIKTEIKDDIVFEISDNGAGIGEVQLRELNSALESMSGSFTLDGISNIALLNIQKRIKLICGKEYGIKVYSSLQNGTTVVIRIPKE